MTNTNQSWNLRAVVRHEQGGRASQQDAVYVGTTLFAVADGFGEGDTAAPAAVGAVAVLDQERDHPDPIAAIEAAVTKAGNVAPTGGDGTTLSTLWFTGGQAVSAHVGDCRLHRIREGHVERLTQDHTLVAALVDEGRLTEEEARSHPHRALINRALAADASVEADLKVTHVSAGDRFVLTSDGVHAVLPADELSSLMLLDDAETAVGRIADAVEMAGAPDNYSVVIVDVG